MKWKKKVLNINSMIKFVLCIFNLHSISIPSTSNLQTHKVSKYFINNYY